MIGCVSVISGTISTCSSFDFDASCGCIDVLGVAVGGFLELETCFHHLNFQNNHSDTCQTIKIEKKIYYKK